METTELTPEYKLWADEAAKMFGGLDIFAVGKNFPRIFQKYKNYKKSN